MSCVNPHVPGGTKELALYCLLALLTGHTLSHECKETDLGHHIQYACLS